MSCLHPLYKYKTTRVDPETGEVLSINPETGKQNLRWCKDGLNTSVQDLKRKYGEDLVPIPCGKCLGCKLDYAKEWAVRCVLESLEHEENCFITLTYDVKNCPEYLVKDDFQKFIKRLRKIHPDVRYFGCGEYGSINLRPHYHAIIFGYKFPKSEVLSSDLYRSKELEKLWPFGISSVGAVTINSCGYVARYCTKKIDLQEKDKKYKEFTLMSTKPGIGFNYYQDHKDFLYLSDFVYGDFGSSVKQPIPRFFDKMAEADGVDLSAVRDRRKRLADAATKLGLGLAGIGHEEELNSLNLLILGLKAGRLNRYV